LAVGYFLASCFSLLASHCSLAVLSRSTTWGQPSSEKIRPRKICLTFGSYLLSTYSVRSHTRASLCFQPLYVYFLREEVQLLRWRNVWFSTQERVVSRSRSRPLPLPSFALPSLLLPQRNVAPLIIGSHRRKDAIS